MYLLRCNISAIHKNLSLKLENSIKLSVKKVRLQVITIAIRVEGKILIES